MLAFIVWQLAAFILYQVEGQTTDADRITAISPTSITVGTTTSITFTGNALSTDTFQFVDAADCSGTSTPSEDPTDGTNQVNAIRVTSVGDGSYILCYQTTGDATNAQAGITLTVVAATPATKITAISPTSITVDKETPITFTGTVAADDLAIFAADCATSPGDTPNIDLTDGADKATDITRTTEASGLKLCYRNAGGSDSVEQTGITLDVVAATSASVITAISPTSITVNTATPITFTGTVAADDLAIFAADCATSPGDTPNIDLTDGADKATDITQTTAASGLKLCYRKAGGSDSVEQAGISLDVTAAAVADCANIAIASPIMFVVLVVSAWD